MHIVLPQESQGKKLDFTLLKHPRTGEPAKFLVNSAKDAARPLFELTRVGSDARSALIDDQIYEDGTMVVATPLHPLYIVLPSLFTHKAQGMPLDILLELSSDENSASLSENIILPHIHHICSLQNDSIDGMIQLDLTKLKTWLDVCAQRLRAGLPPLIKAQLLKAIQPIGPQQDLNPNTIEQIELYGSVSMLSSSWLSPDVAEWYLGTWKFESLEEIAKNLRGQQLALEHAQKLPQNSKREPSENVQTQPAKRAKTFVPPKNNKSILDMFRKA